MRSATQSVVRIIAVSTTNGFVTAMTTVETAVTKIQLCVVHTSSSSSSFLPLFPQPVSLVITLRLLPFHEGSV